MNKTKVAHYLPNYFDALNKEDIEELLEEEAEFRKRGFSLLTDNQQEQLKNKALGITKHSMMHRQPSQRGGGFDRKSKPVTFSADIQSETNYGEGEIKFTMVGSPAYQIYSAVEYQLAFNNQTVDDEVNTKLLLMMPMVPPRFHESIKLRHVYVLGGDIELK